MYKVLIFAAAVASVRAGFLEAPVAAVYSAPHAIASPAVVSQHSNILRTPGNLGQISTYSKSIHTPHSSVTKSDVRVSNDALAYHTAPVFTPAVAAHPITTHAVHATPISVAYTEPIAHAAPVTAIAAHPVATYVEHASPVVVGHIGITHSAASVVPPIAFEEFGAHYTH